VQTLGAGKATFTLDPFFAALVIAGYPTYPVKPATLDFGLSTSPKVTMPVVGGVWDKAHSRGTFVLRGGVDYIHYTTGPLTLHQLSLTRWHAGVNTPAGWTALANGSRITVVDENLMGSHPAYLTIGGHKFVRVNNVILTSDAMFDSAFLTTFGTPIGPMVPFGSATLLARLK
jgi:hypothetical protein